MTKEQWQDLYNTLSKISADFHFNHSAAINRKNDKIRKIAASRADNNMQVAKYYINNNSEVSDLLTGGTSSFGKALFLDEFNQARWFGSDLSDLLLKIQTKIKNQD